MLRQLLAALGSNQDDDLRIIPRQRQLLTPSRSDCGSASGSGSGSGSGNGIDDNEATTAVDAEFIEALESRSYNARQTRNEQLQQQQCGTDDPDDCNHNLDDLPMVIVIAKSVAAVQRVLQALHQWNSQPSSSSAFWRVCIRSGGHAWYSNATWLRNPDQDKGTESTKTILLDVGDLNQISIGANETGDDCVVSAGPGAKGDDILQQLRESSSSLHDVFFPCGHCQGVPLGGFVLGGGYGLGYPKYGLTSSYVSAVDVVLASGQLITVNVKKETIVHNKTSTLEGDKGTLADAEHTTADMASAISQLIQSGGASFTAFPAVIVRYEFDNLPCPCPRGVYLGSLVWSIANWQRALHHALQIQFRGDADACAMETSVMLTHSSDDSGGGAVAILSLVVWGDTPEDGLALWHKYTDPITASSSADAELLLTPVSPPQLLVSPADLPAMAASFYPRRARYVTQAHFGTDRVYEKSDDDIAHLVQPIVDLWQSDKTRPPAPSHTFITPVHSAAAHRKKSANKSSCSTGNAMPMSIQSFVIYQDETMDSQFAAQMEAAHGRIQASDDFVSDLTASDIVQYGAHSSFATVAAFERVQELLTTVDPLGVFARFPV